MCTFCEDPNERKHTPKDYLKYVRDTLDKLYNAQLPRTLVNLVLVLDARVIKELNSGGFVCQILHKRTCPCAAFPTEEQAKILDDYIPQYHQVIIDLIETGRYDGRDDFTVVIQPFMAKTRIPLNDNHKIDFSYFAPDCFHFSGKLDVSFESLSRYFLLILGKGHSQAALSLWNNMLEPVGGKQWSWHMNEPLKCPTDKYPYIFTKKNSAKALQEYQHSSTTPTTHRRSSVSNSISSSTTDSSTTKHHKHHKSHSDPSFSKMQLIIFTISFLLIMMLLIFTVTKRQQIRVFIHGNGRHHLMDFTNPKYSDESDDVEVWNRSTIGANCLASNSLPKTHGSRISFE